MDKTTTLRVRSSTRDRVKALGQQTRQTSDAVVAKAVELYEREQFWAAWEAAQAAMTPEERAQDATEMEPWDRASAADQLAQERRESGESADR